MLRTLSEVVQVTGLCIFSSCCVRTHVLKVTPSSVYDLMEDGTIVHSSGVSLIKTSVDPPVRHSQQLATLSADVTAITTCGDAILW